MERLSIPSHDPSTHAMVSACAQSDNSKYIRANFPSAEVSTMRSLESGMLDSPGRNAANSQLAIGPVHPLGGLLLRVLLRSETG